MGDLHTASGTSASELVAEQIVRSIGIPPCPEILITAVREAGRKNISPQRLVDLMSRDAGLAAPLLKLCNTRLGQSGRKLSSVQEAVEAVGLDEAIILVQTVAMQQSIEPNTQRFEKFWERSALTARAAEKLASRVPGAAPQDAYITTLFHDCGVPVMMLKFPDYRERLMRECTEGRFIHRVEDHHYATDHAVVGHLLARTWQLPPHVCKAILHHHDITLFEHCDQSQPVVCHLIALIHMAECVVDEYLCKKPDEWLHFSQPVLGFLELDESEFEVIKHDMLAFLNGEWSGAA